jgi:RNA polymerase sigma-54 factor
MYSSVGSLGMNALPQLRLQQAQRQTIAPRLQQAVKLLQMSALDFAQTLTDALSRNPFLEAQETDEDINADAEADANLETNAQADSSKEGQTPDDEKMLLDERLDFFNPVPSIHSHNNDLQAIDLLSSVTKLTEHLHQQLNVLSLPERDMALAKTIVESLDDDGYLRVGFQELLFPEELSPQPDEQEWQIALKRVQALDPAGVGARDIQECLLLQLPDIEADTEEKTLLHGIITQEFALLSKRDMAGLARRFKQPLQKIENCYAQIRRLTPRPGSKFSPVPTPYVLPDVIAQRRKGRWIALLNEKLIPRVTLNKSIVDLFSRYRGPACPDLHHHLQEARWTLRNVAQRFSTIEAVAQAIINRQIHFLNHGQMAMKPLSLREIAEEVGVHESTVSRVTSNKYLATPIGVFELKYFFSRPMAMANGAACSPKALQGLVRDMIAEESPAHPLSDTEITQKLTAQGVKISRRTVTKYRLGLRIESAPHRGGVA